MNKRTKKKKQTEEESTRNTLSHCNNYWWQENTRTSIHINTVLEQYTIRYLFM